MITPTPTTRMPLIADIRGMYLDILLKYFEKLSIAKAVKINGKAKPIEYAINNRTPLYIVLILPAYISIEANMGPIQGVQPVAKAMPNKIELVPLPSFPGSVSLFS